MDTNPPLRNGHGKKKILVTGLIFLIVSTSVGLGLYYFGQSIAEPTKVLTKPKIVKEKSPTRQLLSGHPQIYYVNLEYNFRTGVVTIISKGKMNGSPPVFLPAPPSISEKVFIYKVEIISQEDEVIHNGWASELKSLIESSPGKYSLAITSTYKPRATIRILSVKDELIWLGKIE